MLDVTLGILYSPNNKDKILGYNVPADWDSMLDLMKQYNGLETDMPATAFYTNDFVPKNDVTCDGSGCDPHPLPVAETEEIERCQ